MALAHAWWMKQPPKLPSFGLGFSILDATLKSREGLRCRVEQYQWGWRDIPLKWVHRGTVENADDLAEMLKNPLDENSVVYIVNLMEDQAIRALGQYLKIPLRFFDFSYVRLSISNPSEQHVFFSLQFMDMYHDKLSDKDTTICSSNHLPSEALRLHTSPRRRFRACNGEYNTHVWYITCVRLVLLKSKDMKTFRGVVELDPADNAIVTGLTKLMTCDEDSDLTDTEKYAGFGRLISHIIYIVTFTWKEFFHEAEANVEFISRRCLQEETLSSKEQLQYTRELHELSPLWIQVRRRLRAAKELSEQMIKHPFFKDIDGMKGGNAAVEATLRRKIRTLDDHISRCNELADETKVLISLIYNISTLQETKAANNFAASIRRVTMLTFIYLPLSLASSIFGMNITQISDGTGSPLWAYFVVAIALMVATFGGCLIWSRILSGWKQRERKVLALQQRSASEATSVRRLPSIHGSEKSLQSEQVRMGSKGLDMV